MTTEVTFDGRMRYMENRKIKLTKRLLKESLIELLKQKDISHITIKEISENADLNRSTFYSHYQDVYQLLDEITQEVVSRIPFAYDGNDYNISNIAEFIDYIHQHKDIFSVLLRQGALHQYIAHRSHEIFLNGSVQNGSMKACDMEVYDALSAFCIAGAESFLSCCINGDISTTQQAQILFKMIESAKSIVLSYPEL